MNIFKRIAAIAICAATVISLVSCAPAEEKSEEPGKLKASLTNPELTYSKEELEALKASGVHYSYDYDVPALYKYFENRCYIGTIVNSWWVTNREDLMAKSIAKNYNILVTENEFKSGSINPAEGQYNFDGCDAFIDFAKESGAKVRAHTIVWHTQVPDWWFKADPKEEKSLGACARDGLLASSDQLLERLSEYMEKIFERYKDDIDYWDICNEVLNADGIRRIADDKSYWADIVGDLNGDGYYDDYVEFAFKKARELDEDGIFMINDFNMEWQDSKTNAMYNMLERFMRNGTRIDGVGFQTHIAVDTDINAFRRNLEKIASLADVYDECFPEHKGEFRIQITELDMNMFVGAYREKRFVKWTDEDLERQSKQFADLMSLFLEFADRGVLDAVVFWAPDDAHSWINDNKNGLPCLYSSEMELKDCYYAFVETSFN